MEYLGAWGTLLHEKNLKSKISCQTPFKSISNLEDPGELPVLRLYGQPPVPLRLVLLRGL